MTDYNEKSVEELRELAAERELEGRSKLTKKDQLVAALEALEADAAPADDFSEVGHDSEASDPQNSEVVSALSDSGEEALSELGEDSEAAELADLALDASGPLHLQSPSEREMVGAVTPEQAEEQTKLIGDLPEDYVGTILEDGSLPNAPADKEPVDYYADYPAPLEAPSQEYVEQARDDRSGGPVAFSRAAALAFPDEGPTVAQPRLYEQRGQLYTDGVSGQADHNVEMAYRVPDVRGGIFSTRAGDESPQAAERQAIEAERVGDEE